MDCGFFYLVNHGVEEHLLERMFDESRKFFSLPLEEKMKFPRKENRGYTPLYAENLDPSTKSKGSTSSMTSKFICLIFIIIFLGYPLYTCSMHIDI